MAADFSTILSTKRILICVGSGGVGKTTCAAALALAGARAGRRTLVLTIDPAKRLATSMGLPQLTHEVQRVQDDRLAQAGPAAAGGALYAMMLDQKRAFDEIVERHARDPATRQRILDNPIYRQVSTSLAGSHEYAAMAKLYEIDRERERYELIVVDTPPTSHALDFLDAPEKVARAIDSPAIQWFTKPFRASGRFSLRMIGAGSAFVLKRIAKFVGSAFLEDMARFFVEFNDVLGGFRERAGEVSSLLRRDDVAFVVVAAPEPSVVDEALFFHQRLAASAMPLAGFVVNRVHPEAAAAPPVAEAAARLAVRPECRQFAPYELHRAAETLVTNHEDFAGLASADRREIGRLRRAAGADAPLVEIPFLEHDVHDLGGLAEVGGYLVPVQASPPSRSSSSGSPPKKTSS